MSTTTPQTSSNNIANAAIWTSGSIAMVRVFFFISSIITARLLNSEDFGLIGIAGSIYMLINTANTTGVDSFLIFKQGLTSKEHNTAFTLNSLFAVLFGSLVIIIGVLIAQIYHRHEIQDILLFAGISLFFSTLGAIPRAFLVKNMKQQILAVIDTSVNLLNLVLIILFAFLGFKHLSYVIPLMLYQIVCTTVLFIIAGQAYRPTFNKEVFLEIFKYSRNFAPQTLIADVLYQVDYLIGSLFLTSAMMGFYYFGFEKAFLITVFTRGVSEQVFFPVFAKAQKDPVALKENYFKLSAYFMFILFPILFVVIFLAKDLLLLIFGSQWSNSIFTFQCILAFCLLKINYDITITLFNAVGKSEQNLKHFLLVAPHTILFFLAGGYFGGIAGLAFAALLAHSLSAFIMMRRLNNNFGWPVSEQILHFIKYLLPACIVLPLIFVIKFLFTWLAINSLFSLVTLILIFFMLYLGCSSLLNPEIPKSLLGLVRKKLKIGLESSSMANEDVLTDI